jgi:DNA invertase Pin-like site-specific DNA recombinase
MRDRSNGRDTRYVAYYRVSTARQGRSGLGLEAQRDAVRNYLNGGAWKLLAEFTEVESGRRSDRPQLAAALAACRVQNATLIIAKLDRLARSVAFTSSLMEAGVMFEAVDLPQANSLTIHVMSAVAEHEARLISERTRAALASAKARGVKLGGFRGRPGTRTDCAQATQARKNAADRRAADIRITIDAIRAGGLITLTALAGELNRREIRAPRGGPWSRSQVRAVLRRAEAL